MATLERVNIAMDLETQRLEKGLKRAEGQLKRSTKKMQTQLGGLAKRGATAAAGLTAGLTAFAVSTSRTVSELNHLSRSMNLTIERGQTINNLFKEYNLDVQEASAATNRVAEVIAEAAAGHEEYAGWVKEMGLNIKEMQELSADERLFKWFDGLKNVGDESRRQWIALSTLPGKLVEEGGTLMDITAKQYAEMHDKAIASGRRFTQATADQIFAYESLVQYSTEAMQTGFMNGLLAAMPAVGDYEDLLSQLNETAYKVGETFGNTITFIWEHKEAIMQTAIAYGVFMGARAASGVISTLAVMRQQFLAVSAASIAAGKKSQFAAVNMYNSFKRTPQAIKGATLALWSNSKALVVYTAKMVVATAQTLAFNAAQLATRGGWISMGRGLGKGTKGFGKFALQIGKNVLPKVGKLLFNLGRFTLVGAAVTAAVAAVVGAFQVWRDGADITNTRMQIFVLKMRIMWNKFLSIFSGDGIKDAFKSLWSYWTKFMARIAQFWEDLKNLDFKKAFGRGDLAVELKDKTAKERALILQREVDRLTKVLEVQKVARHGKKEESEDKQSKDQQKQAQDEKQFSQQQRQAALPDYVLPTKPDATGTGTAGTSGPVPLLQQWKLEDLIIKRPGTGGKQSDLFAGMGERLVENIGSSIIQAARTGGLKGAGKSILENLSNAINDIASKAMTDLFRSGIKGILNIFGAGNLSSSLFPTAHDGAIIAGPRGKEVPIMAQAGEMILPLEESRRLRRTLGNQDRTPASYTYNLVLNQTGDINDVTYKAINRVMEDVVTATDEENKERFGDRSHALS